MSSASHNVSHIRTSRARTSLAQLEASRTRRLTIARLMKLVDPSLIGVVAAAALDSPGSMHL